MMRLSDAEWTVMAVLWQQGPATARTVLEAVGEETQWAYTTVKTILDRLVDKGALRPGKAGNATVYEPLVTRQRARRMAVRSLLDRAFDGTVGSLLQHLLHDERLSKRERERLRQLLEEEEGGDRR